MRTAGRTVLAVLAAVLPRAAAAAPPADGVTTAWAALTSPPRRVLADGHAGPVVAALFIPGGTGLLTAGGDRTIVRWDPATGRALGRVTVHTAPGDVFPTHPGGAVFAPGGSRLVAAVRDDAVAAFDPATGAERAEVRFPDHQPTGEVRVAVSADGGTVLATFPTRANNAAAVAAVVARPAGGGPPVERVFTGPGRQRWSPHWAAALAPDGSKVVVARAVRAVRAQRCELVAFAPGDGAAPAPTYFPFGNLALAAAIAPDNRTAVVAGPDGQLVLWDLVTRHPRHWLDVIPLGYTPPAFAADGRTVAVVTGTSSDGRTAVQDYRVRVLEVATGGVRFELDPDGYVTALAVAPDGSAVAAGLRDRTAVAWDVSPAAGPRWWDRAPSDSDRLWAALSAGSARQAWPAVRELVGRPDVAVRLFRQKLPPAPPPGKPTAAGVAALVARLDAPGFADREAAEKALRDLGPLVAVELRAAVRATRSAEARDRLDHLLDRIDHPPAPTRGEARAVEVLERAATPAARELLAGYAAGHSPLAAEARAALARLAPK